MGPTAEPNSSPAGKAEELLTADAFTGERPGDNSGELRFLQHSLCS